MLAQLVCVDRRYQRMNCFNIRELQSMLKRRFFTDLVSLNDHHTLLNNTMVGLRFKSNNTNLIDSDILSFYNYGTNFTTKHKSNSFTNNYSTDLLFSTSRYKNYLPTNLNHYFTNLGQTLTNVFYNIITLLQGFNPYSVLSITQTSSVLLDTLS